jgi:hypothetical protein
MASLAVCAAHPASAAGVSALKSPYHVILFQVNRSNVFEGAFTIGGTGGAKVGGLFAAVPFKGKLTNQGKLTFSGNGAVKITNGKGQVSATGRFILGSFKVTQSSEPEERGTYVFRAETGSSPVLLGVGVQGVSVPGLESEYGGSYHDNARSDDEDEKVQLLNIVEASNGKFTADIAGVHVSGKRTGNKVTFKGKLKDGNSTLTLQGATTLNSAHQLMIGKLTQKGTGKFPSGKGTLELYFAD